MAQTLALKATLAQELVTAAASNLQVAGCNQQQHQQGSHAAEIVSHFRFTVQHD
jgi:hypothetical protein